MNLHILFVVLVVAGFFFHLFAEWPLSTHTRKAAWGCWFVASLIWAATPGP